MQIINYKLVKKIFRCLCLLQSCAHLTKKDIFRTIKYKINKKTRKGVKNTQKDIYPLYFLEATAFSLT